MKIQDLNNAGAAGAGQAANTRKVETDGAASRRPGASREGGDRVEFSANLRGLSRALSTDSGQRVQRVEALAAQYQSGTYQVDAAAVSHAMVGDALSAAAHAG